MNCTKRSLSSVALFCAVSLLMLSNNSAKAAPTISKLSLRGLQISGVTTVTIEGSDLSPQSQIVLPVKIAHQLIKEGGSSKRIEVEITIHRSAEPGIYQLRVANSKGISNPMAIGIDRLPQRPMTAEIQELPIALHGNLTGTTVLSTSFQGKKGQRIVVEVESRRLGGKLSPVVRLLDSRGTQLAWDAARGSIAGDARCELILPADGKYTAQLQDALFRGASPGHFRLKIGSFHYADLVYPLGIRQGTTPSLEYVSASIPSALRVPARREKSSPRSQPAPWPSIEPLSGARPRIIVSDFEEVVEQQTTKGKLQAVSAPSIAINGRLAKANEEDRYLLSVQPSTSIRFEIMAQRLGSPLDGVFSIQDEAGKTLATSDDQKNTSDPGLVYKVPANTKKLVLSIKDLQGRGGRDYVYRVEATQVGTPDFSLSIDKGQINIPAGGSEVLKIQAVRTGYNGPIKLEFASLPEGVTVKGAEIVAGSNIALVTLTASEAQPACQLGRLIGKSTDSEHAMVRVARLQETPVSKYQPWLGGELALATTEQAQIRIDWSSKDGKLSLGSKYPIKASLHRIDGVQGAIRVSLLTNQIIPKKQAPDPKDKKKKISVDDLDRALRLASSSIIAADKSEIATDVFVPGDLAAIAWDMVLKAELLSDDRKTVLATAVSSVKRVTAVRQFEIELTGEPKVEVKVSVSAGILTGRIIRHDGFSHPITVSLAGLPKEYSVPQVVVPVQQQEFVLAIGFPAGTKPGELAVKLRARSQTDPQNPGLVALSNEIPVKLQVTAGE